MSNSISWQQKLYVLLFRWAGKLPVGLLATLGGGIGWLLTLFPLSVASAYRVTLTNILLCYPQLSPGEARRLARQALVESGRSFAEFAHVWSNAPETSLKRITHVTGMDALKQAYASDRPVLLLTLHQSSWELPNLLIAPEGPMTVFYQPDDNPLLTELVTRSRQSTGSTLVTADATGIKAALAAMARKESVAILVDHMPKAGNNPWIPFFGISALTSNLPAKLIRRYNPHVFFVGCHREQGTNDVHVYIEPATEKLYGDDERQILTAMNETLAALISRWPAQYHWVNKRFRRTPEGRSTLYKPEALPSLKAALKGVQPLRVEDLPLKKNPGKIGDTKSARRKPRMPQQSLDNRWSATSKAFHWIAFLVIIAVFVTVNVAEGYERGSDEKIWWMMLHRSFGLVAMTLMVIWLLARLRIGRPDPYGARWQERLSWLTHWGMILLILGMPVAGLAMSQFAGRDVSVFGLFSIPAVIEPNRDIATQIHFVHTSIAAPLLATLVLIHIAGAFWHHFIDRDHTLKRMLPGYNPPTDIDS